MGINTYHALVEIYAPGKGDDAKVVRAFVSAECPSTITCCDGSYYASLGTVEAQSYSAAIDAAERIFEWHIWIDRLGLRTKY